MNRPRAGLTILAHFPDVSESTHAQSSSDEGSRWNPLASGSRWIGQAAAVKLLAGMTLFMIVGAILPFYLGHKTSPGDTASQSGAFATCSSVGQETSTQALPLQGEGAGTPVARQQAVRVSATPEQSVPPATLPSRAEAPHQPSPPTVAESLMAPRAVAESKPAVPTVPTVAESSMSTPWSPPAEGSRQPGAANSNVTASNANSGSGAIRPTEYEADARGHRAGDRSAAEFEGTIDGTKR